MSGCSIPTHTKHGASLSKRCVDNFVDNNPMQVCKYGCIQGRSQLAPKYLKILQNTSKYCTKRPQKDPKKNPWLRPWVYYPHFLPV